MQTKKELILEFVKSSKSFNGQTIIRDFCLQLYAKQVISLVGMSGCGKTTVLKIASGIIHPDNIGSILWYDKNKVLTHPCHPISVVFQNQGLLPWRNAISNILLPTEICDYSYCNIDEILSMVEFDNNGDLLKYPHELSGGMKTKVALARAFCTKTNLILLDEPLAHLDSFTKENIIAILLKLFENQNHGVLYVTHDLKEAAILSDTILIFADSPKGIYKIINVPAHLKKNLSITEDSEFFYFIKSIRELF